MFQQHNCPNCGSTNLVKKGATYLGKARLKCKCCGRQFVQMRTHQPLSTECKRAVRRRGIELLPAERVSLEAICRVLEIKPHQLYTYMDELQAEMPHDLAY